MAVTVTAVVAPGRAANCDMFRQSESESPPACQRLSAVQFAQAAQRRPGQLKNPGGPQRRTEREAIRVGRPGPYERPYPCRDGDRAPAVRRVLAAAVRPAGPALPLRLV